VRRVEEKTRSRFPSIDPEMRDETSATENATVNERGPDRTEKKRKLLCLVLISDF